MSERLDHLLSKKISDEVARAVAREGRVERRVSFGKHHYGHVGQRALRKVTSRARARIARASLQKNRRLAR